MQIIFQMGNHRRENLKKNKQMQRGSTSLVVREGKMKVTMTSLIRWAVIKQNRTAVLGKICWEGHSCILLVGV